MEKKNLVWILLFIVALITLVSFLVFKEYMSGNYEKLPPKTATVVHDFEGCAAAGYPVQTSYPSKCTAQGQTFTESANINQAGDSANPKPVSH